MTSKIAKVARAFQFVLVTLGCAVIGESQALADETAVPQLVGTWIGKNFTVSDKKGFVDWGTKTVQITEQKDRRFRGQFSYPAGTKHFFGVIYPDNVSFTWVATDSKGYNHGRILTTDTIAACYVESGEEATAGCAELTRPKADK
jgi:hypothetical protein